MKIAPCLLLLAVPGLVAVAAHAQTTKPNFKPGEWEVSSTVTPSMGSPVHQQVEVCAQAAGETLGHRSQGQMCEKPVTTPIAKGYNVRLKCSGGGGPVKWTSMSSIDEVFDAAGDSFEAHGTTTTNVMYAGRAPIQASATMVATGKRIGSCKK